MLAHSRIRTQTEFSNKLLEASRKYLKLCKGNDAKLRANKKVPLATRAAHDHYLHYPDGEIDPLIVSAILAFADKSKSELERANALVEAWEAYDNKWFNKTLH